MAVIKVNCAFEFGEAVKLASGDQTAGVVLHYELLPGNVIKYYIRWGSADYGFYLNSHYEFELQKTN